MSDIAIAVDQQRADGLIGASDAAAILGLDKYRPPIAVWRKLRGLTVDDAEDSEPARWGTVIEPLVRGHYALKERCIVYVPVESLVMDGWLRATPDGLVRMGGEPDTVSTRFARELITDGAVESLLQVKTCSAYLADEWAERPPARVEVQCRVEMAVAGLQWNDAVCLIGGQRYVCHRVHRDQRLEDNILADLAEFWRKVKNGIEPDVDASQAWRAHVSERMRASKVSIEARGDTAEVLDTWRVTRGARIKLEAREEECKNLLLKSLADAGATKLLHASGDVCAQRKAAQTKWKEYALALGGTAEGAERFKGEPGAWFLRAPNDWSKENE